MKRIGLLLLALLLAVSCCAAAEENVITGAVEDGCYVLRLPMNGTDGETWQAEAPADGAVRVGSAEEENGVFTVRFEPASDGTVTVTLRHCAGDMCDALHTFDLVVREGKVQEVTGGSYTAAPDEDELEPVLSGEWLEKDTQFTSMFIRRSLEGGWDLEIVSPVSHEAWALRARMFYDCGAEGLIYRDGCLYALPTEDAGAYTEREPAETGLTGRLTFAGSEEAPELVWTPERGLEGRTVTFGKAPALPAYRYTGADPIEGAVADCLAEIGRAEGDSRYPDAAAIPAPVILKTEMAGDAAAKVYGRFWIIQYIRHGTVLEMVSGWVETGVMTLEKDDGGWKVTGLDSAGDGDRFWPDIERICDGDRELEEAFRDTDLREEKDEAVRARLIRDYAEANGLNIGFYQDPYWPAVPLAGDR